jgi:hypothetical protein
LRRSTSARGRSTGNTFWTAGFDAAFRQLELMQAGFAA